MKSITELSKKLGCDKHDLNRILIKNQIYVHTKFGINDGFIQHDVSDYIENELGVMAENLFSIDDILNNKSIYVPIIQGAYVYFLLDDDTIVYIGQSNQILGRINEHNNSQKEFNYVSIFRVESKMIDIIEHYHINKYSPMLNNIIYSTVSIIDEILKKY